jgi:transposase
MGQNFIGCDREQELLLPPSLREWLPDDHFAWFVIDAVAELDLAAFYASYRADGHGRAAHEPAMMVALLLYSYALGERSSRRVERRCVEDVATRVICANQTPDHTTIETVASLPSESAGASSFTVAASNRASAERTSRDRGPLQVAPAAVPAAAEGGRRTAR